MSETIDQEIDARGMICPLPVLKAGKVLRAMPAGSVVLVLADDPLAVIDIPQFCIESGHALLAETDTGEHQTYLIKKIA